MTLEQLRTQKGITSEEMAKGLGISLSSYEKKEKSMRLKADELMKAFEILKLNKNEINSLTL